MGYVALLLGLAAAGMVIVWLNRRTMETNYLRAERNRMEEILEECVLVRSDLEQMLAEFSRQSSELVKQLERQSPRAEKLSPGNVQKVPETSVQLKVPPGAAPERYREIDRMLEKGLDLRDIAENLQIGIGELQLLVNLNKRVCQDARRSE